jgi:hypothetical protein
VAGGGLLEPTQAVSAAPVKTSARIAGNRINKLLQFSKLVSIGLGFCPILGTKLFGHANAVLENFDLSLKGGRGVDSRAVAAAFDIRAADKKGCNGSHRQIAADGGDEHGKHLKSPGQ